jgi:hypothetical protein
VPTITYSLYRTANHYLLTLQDKIFSIQLTSTWHKKALLGNNVFILVEMVNDQRLVKYVVLPHILKSSYHNALVTMYHSLSGSCCRKDYKHTGTGIR